MSPTARSLTLLRRLGFLAESVEKFIPAVQRKRDLFGIADVLAFHPRDRLALLVQCTSGAHVGDRLKRIKARWELPLLLRSGVGVEVWGWYKHDQRWRVKRVAVRAEDLADVVLDAPRHRRQRKWERQRDLFTESPSKPPSIARDASAASG
jgi:hypothetical protein